MKHYALEYSKYVNEILHTYLTSTWNYKHEIYELPGLLTALLITYDNQNEDEFEIFDTLSWEEFLQRMVLVKSDWINFDKKIMESLATKPQKTMLGWEGRTIYFIRGGNNKEFWGRDNAFVDVTGIMTASAVIQGPSLLEKANDIKALIPTGHKHFQKYEDYIRICINYIFNNQLGEAKAQKRTEPGNEGVEIRDLLAPNMANDGIFYDLKNKYSCSEILFEVKNKNKITRDDLRQIYCYLKPALCLWGFIVCRTEQPERIHSYNRTLFKNFTQTRGVLILTDQDIKKMIEMKFRDRDPAEFIQEKFSNFNRSV